MSNANQNSKSNVGVSILYLFGSLLAIYAIIAYIAHLFNYKLRVSGADIPSLDLISTLIVLLIAGVVYSVGYFFDKSRE